MRGKLDHKRNGEIKERDEEDKKGRGRRESEGRKKKQISRARL